MVNAHTLPKQTTKKLKRLGQGHGTGRGKTSGRGTKGQKARAGHRMRPEIRDVIKKIPKRRGYRFSPIMKKGVMLQVVNVKSLEKAFVNGEEVTAAHLAKKELIIPISGKLPTVKILGDGILSKKLTVKGCRVSASARKKIEAVGGVIVDA